MQYFLAVLRFPRYNGKHEYVNSCRKLVRFSRMAKQGEKTMKKGMGSLAMTVLLVSWSGCVSSRSGQVYNRDQVQKAVEVYYGVVEDVREVLIEGTKSGLGAIAGGVAGGVVGSTIGGGRGTRLATTAGALGGAGLGAVAEEKLTRKKGLEIQVKLDDGRSMVIVQEADRMFQVGDRVRVLLGSDGVYRVRP